MNPAIAAVLESAVSAAEAAHGTVPATYARGEDSAAVDLLLIQSAAFYLSADENISTRVNQTAFLVKPSQIDFGAGPVDPQAGDVVTFELGTWVFTYAVCRNDSGGPCFALTDQYGTRLKVHASLKARVAT